MHFVWKDVVITDKTLQVSVCVSHLKRQIFWMKEVVLFSLGTRFCTFAGT
ncbi:hypothetical protein HanXRQr2_Chr10g0461171 [Helianthus annuus]|uniref:Uncharacterized protein n=1 Tax=Helianthus annuus TaxID=4232 RepID=A0A9K3N632_HELAN|nr:hypothetical protein HanXRQr2_Chr10g0461171 [Helianthus annuus]